MNIAILQVPLTLQELNQLSKEFPQFLFMSFSKYALTPISKEHWHKAEVYFGEKLTCEDLNEAHQLRWIQTPTSNISRLCLKDIEMQGNILVSNVIEENIFQIGEYVLAVVLAFAKNLFQWKEVNRFPAVVWDCKWRNKMWTLKDKVFLQIGLEKTGIEIARRAHDAGMKVWGMDATESFHPYCHKNLSFKDLLDALKEADIVSLAQPQEKGLGVKLGPEELKRMKHDSILTVLGPVHSLDEETLSELASQGKFRGILLDSNYQTPVRPQSLLWKIPQLLLTPDVAPRPKDIDREAFKLFRYNLRQYIHGNFSEMKNLIDPSIAYVPPIEDWT